MPEDLLACADGDGQPVVMRHVGLCASCAAEVAAYAHVQGRLRRALYRVTCPSAQTLGEYELDVVSQAERVAVASHVVECPRCTEELQALRVFLRSVPDKLPTRVGSIERLRRIVALPVPLVLGYGMRGDRSTTTRSYSGGVVTIEISQAPETRHGHFAITGLVWRSDDPEGELAGEAQLVGVDGTSYLSPIEVFRTFAFEYVPEGVYKLLLRLPVEVVIVENLPVGV